MTKFEPIHSGVRHTDDEGSRIEWELYSRKEFEEMASLHEVRLNTLKNREIKWLTGREVYYGGPGRRFYSHPGIRVSRNYVLVTQYTGLDI